MKPIEDIRVTMRQECESHIAAEKLAGNVVKEEFWKGALYALTALDDVDKLNEIEAKYEALLEAKEPCRSSSADMQLHLGVGVFDSPAYYLGRIDGLIKQSVFYEKVEGPDAPINGPENAQYNAQVETLRGIHRTLRDMARRWQDNKLHQLKLARAMGGVS